MRMETDLTEYRRKRDFRRTPEPAAKTKKSQTGRLYVIHKHEAGRLHYDFRLEHDGVLLSWAVPKGPSLDPGEKRLAVHVEDHPVEYGDFEGVIPKGQYGGGTVMVADHGTWEPKGDFEQALTTGKLKFTLHGQRLRGDWTLVRMGGKAAADGRNWLLIKERDAEVRKGAEADPFGAEPVSTKTGRSMQEIAARQDAVWHSNRPSSTRLTTKRRLVSRAAARAAAGDLDPSALKGAKAATLPERVSPQLATLVKEVPQGDDWLHEMKFDGYRMLCVIKSGRVRLITRNGKDWTPRFHNIAAAAEDLPVKNAIVDGEIVMLNERGLSDFQALQNSMKGAAQGQIAYFVFDLPFCNGYDLTHTPLDDRKGHLSRIVAGLAADSPIRYSDHVVGHGTVFLQQACRAGLEGVISKRADSRYEHRRTDAWVKVKCVQRQEFVIGGYTDPTGARTGYFGALLLGYYDAQGRLTYCGRVGTGFTVKSLQTLHQALVKRERETSPFYNPPAGREARGVHWVVPELVAEVEFGEWTNEGILRHPSFRGLREDKAAREVVRESAKRNTHAGREGRVTAKRAKKASSVNPPAAKPVMNHSIALPAEVAGVRLSNPDRVLYPEAGLTKADVAHYYEQVAEWVLPHVANRPLSLVRCPRGTGQKCFFQKHIHEGQPAALRGIEIREKDEVDTYIVLDNLAGLISLVQISVLEIHPWGSKADDVDRPDRMIFDIDPGPGTPWTDVLSAARLIRDRLTRDDLESFVKTTGGKGLHVVAPIQPRDDWESVKAYTRRIADEITRADPGRFVATMSKSKRPGKIFIDYLRNSRGATAVAAYSTRARGEATVSTPLKWQELTPNLDPGEFTIHTVPKRLSARRKDPWEGFFKVKQTLPR